MLVFDTDKTNANIEEWNDKPSTVNIAVVAGAIL